MVYAGDGDDLVCVTGKTVGLEGQTFLGTGTGRDRVDASKSESVFFTSLGGGSDEYIGGPARDTVLDGGRAVDLISTSGGHDRVFTHGGADVVDLGAGTDRLLLLGDPSEGAVLTGGAGSNTLGIQVLGVQGTHSWKVDNDAESLLRDGNPEVSWERFEHFDVAARGPVTFIGTDLDETLALRKHLGFAGAMPWRPRWPLDVRMRGGDDIVTFYGASVSTSISGGEGVDQLRYETPSFESSAQIAVRIDLSRGILRVTKTPGTETTQRTVNFEDVAVSNYSFRVDADQGHRRPQPAD